ncbi:PAS domain-containing sensor histidine kinase [Zobellia alginiliquefaciens]|uniref:PAS domain-containing sensor histidine kinase n=1 Tax=Zobellia alginiliquefaciens TaxID=3032586 RepID=UPI0023E43427|nr:PAS domain S-box protein [Zobellia alginiliquefaciens]
MNIENYQIEDLDEVIADLNAIARIGYWIFNVQTGEYKLDRVSYEILQLPDGTDLHDKKSTAYCRNETKWTFIKKLIHNAVEQNSSFNHEVELEVPSGNSIWVLLIGKCITSTEQRIKVSGMIQDITARKESENELIEKNELLNFTENKAALGHWKWDISTNLVTCSKNISRIIKVPYGKRISVHKLTGSVHPEDIEDVRSHLNNAVKTKTFETLFHRFRLEDGSERIIQVLGEPIIDEDSTLKGFICSSQDITKIKQFEEELLKKNQLFKVAQQRAKFGYWQWEVDTDTVICSQNMAQLLKVEENVEFPLNTLIKDVHPEDVSHVRASLEQIIKQKYFNSFSHRVVIDNQLIYVKVQGKVITDSDGEIVNILGVSQDVTDQKIIENELRSNNQLLGFAEKISKIGHWQWDFSTNYIKWSTNLYRIFEVEEGTPIKFDTYFNFIHPDDAERVTAKIDALSKHKNFEGVIHRIVLKNGKIKTVELLATVNLDRSANIIEMLGTLQDVSEQRADEMKFKALLESAPNATLILGKDNIIQMINLQAEHLFGYTSQELVGQSIDLIIPSRYDEIRAPLRDAFYANPEVKTYDIGKDFYMYDKQRNEIPVEVTLGPLQLEGGFLLSVVVRDITAEKNYQHKILKAKEELEVLTEELTAQNLQLADFTQITSHNLRAPVSNLNSLVDIYKMMDDEQERNALFEKFETVISHLTLTLNTLIEALSAKNDASVERSEVSFSEVLMKTQEIFTAEITKTKAVIKSDFSQIDTLKYHKIYLDSIFQNLIGNSLKYKAKERTPQIEVTSEMSDNKVILKFKDNGLGIDLKKHGHKIFGLNKVFHNHPEAKGIGLFMTKTQIEAMGGKIFVSSKINEGTTFSIHFN